MIIAETTPRWVPYQPSACASPATKPIGVSRALNASETPIVRPEPSRCTGSQLLSTIRTLGDLLDDLERVRVQHGNRIGDLERRYGTSLPHLDVIAQQVRAAEHAAELELVRAWRLHPLAAWCKQVPGAGEKTVARLIAEIGDPADRPNPAKLWAYCGLGDPTRQRRKGMSQGELFALGNPAAKKRCWLIGEAFVRTNRGVYRDAYDAARERYADRVHVVACVRCGPSGHPAPAGSPWSLKHQHEAAKRFAVKLFLRDLWIAARHAAHAAHANIAGGDPEQQSTAADPHDSGRVSRGPAAEGAYQ